MQQHPILHQNHYGQITQCSYCGCIQLAFGNVIFNITENDFFSFRQLINHLVQKYRHRQCTEPNTRITIQMDIPDFFISLNIQELLSLGELVNQAYLMMEVNGVLKDAG